MHYISRFYPVKLTNISRFYTFRALQDQIDLLQKSNRKLEAELDDKRIDYEKFKVILK